MLITQPFTNEQVAERLDAIRAAECINPNDLGILAEACRRLRGWLPSGADNHNDLIIKMGEALSTVCGDDKYYEPRAHAAFDAYEDWCNQFHPYFVKKRTA